MNRLEFAVEKQLHLVGIMRRRRPVSGRTIRLDRLAPDLARLVPTGQHDKAVAVPHPHLAAVLRFPDRCCAERIRTAIRGQIDLAPDQPLNSAEWWIDPAKTHHQSIDNLAQFGLGVGQRSAMIGIAIGHMHHRLTQRISPAFTVAIEVPRFEQILRRLQLGFGFHIGRQNLGNPTSGKAVAAICCIEFDREQLFWRQRSVGFQEFERAHDAVGHACLDPQRWREISGVEFRPFACCHKRGVVGICHKPRRWVDDHRRCRPRQDTLCQSRTHIARQDFGIIETGFAVWKNCVVKKADLAGLVGIDEIGRRNAARTHGRNPPIVILRLLDAEILFEQFDIVHAGIADGKRAIFVDDHRPVLGTIDGLRNRKRERAEFDWQPDALLPQRFPFAVHPVLRLVGVGNQFVDIDKVGLVHRIGPAEIAVVTQQDEWRAGEQCARHVEPFARMNHRLIPGHAAFIRLVRIGDQPGFAIGHPLWCHCKSIRPIHRRFAARRGQVCHRHVLRHFIVVQFFYDTIEPVEKRRAQHKARRDVASANREQF